VVFQSRTGKQRIFIGAETCFKGLLSRKTAQVQQGGRSMKITHAAPAKFHPLARMGKISDIVDPVLYLQNATFVTGENIRVDGGVHAGR
jgi:NAD(P)-dependent dehydrogenase (short-subunit alcohol dehydrogenase family)